MLFLKSRIRAGDIVHASNSARRRRAGVVGALLLIVLSLAAACTSVDPTPTSVPLAATATVAPEPTSVPPTATATVAPEPTATATPEPAPVEVVSLIGGDPDFDLGTMIWQGYWLSRDHFGPFVMGSGMGIPFAPPMDTMMGAMSMVAQNEEDMAMIPQNMLPLQAVFVSGASDLANDPRDFDPMDFEGLRLVPSTFDETVGVRAQASTMLKESQWAHSFSSAHFGNPTDDFGAQQRFMGVMVNMLAQMQGRYAMENLMGDDGLYHDSNGELDYTGNWVMLHALSDIAGLATEGRYANPDMAPMFDNAASGLLVALESRIPGSPQEAATAVRALIYRASTTSGAAIRDNALTMARSITDLQLSEFESDDPIDNAAAIVGLIAMSAVDDSAPYRDAAQRLFQKLSADFDAAHGVFESRSIYNVDDVAWVIGSLNSLLQKGNSESTDAVGKMLLAFYESTISLAGMQLSAPPGKNGAMIADFEKDLPSVLYYHPAGTPPPPMVGKLTVPAEEIQWDGSSWRVTSDRFNTAGAMHLANELNWLGPHLGSIPFPGIEG